MNDIQKSESADSSLVTGLVANALKLPLVKVDRKAFLLETLPVQNTNIDKLLKLGPIKSGLFTQAQIKKHALSIIKKRKWQTTGTSFLTGIPGGIAMAATIPADTLQFFGFNLRVAQELAYLYGYQDFWKDGILDNEIIESELMLFLATMFGVGGAASATRYVTNAIAKKLAVDLPKQALTKTFYYPIAKTLAGYIGIKLTKDSFAKGVSKAVPILGGIVSGGLTYYAMSKMSTRLCETFDIAVDYTPEEIQDDIATIKKEMPDVYDTIARVVEDKPQTQTDETSQQ